MRYNWIAESKAKSSPHHLIDQFYFTEETLYWAAISLIKNRLLATLLEALQKQLSLLPTKNSFISSWNSEACKSINTTKDWDMHGGGDWIPRANGEQITKAQNESFINSQVQNESFTNSAQILHQQPGPRWRFYSHIQQPTIIKKILPYNSLPSTTDIYTNSTQIIIQRHQTGGSNISCKSTNHQTFNPTCIGDTLHIMIIK